ncbi:MAG TPA: Jag N-terminal domain-containing protein, partial [Desulfurivibrionaceae bacterium]|nr:Jag N-terminal domain-containing protein [Desulfurivibrionaceae bacterium]
MSQKIEYTGSDVTEAIGKACRELGVSQDALQIEVVAAGSSGIFGLFGKKKAVIAVTIKKSGREEKAVNRGAGEGSKSSRPRRGERRDDKKDERRGERKAESRDSEAPSARRTPEKPPAEITPEILATVKVDLEKILELMGFGAQVSLSNEENRIVAKLEGGNEEEIIGPEGQTLDSLQYLMRKIISRRVEGKV